MSEAAMTEAFAMAVLVSAYGVGYAQRERLLAQAGGAKAALAEPEAYAHILGADGLAALRASIRDAEALQKVLECWEIRLVARGEDGYPPLLAQIAQPPHLLFVQGRADLTDPFPFAIVGTRSASEYGLRHTRVIARDLARAGMCVVSGLALGVDAAAHRGALEGGGRTVAVLGGALDAFYPAANRPLRDRILESGGSVVSEFPPGIRPTRYSFLQRNRIIAGMSLGTLVTEGPERSGALRTATDALEEGREVFALPGSVDSPLSRLPHRLLSEGARPAFSARDILDALVVEPDSGPRLKLAPNRAQGPKSTPDSQPSQGPQPSQDSLPSQDAQPSPVAKPKQNAQRTQSARDAKAAKPARRRDVPPELDAQGRAVFEALLGGELDFDALAERTRVPADELGALLTLMELDGHVEALGGLRYRLAE